MDKDENKAIQQEKPSHLWQPGQSGNPSGRPKKSDEEKQLAAEVMSGIQRLGPMTVQAIEKVLNPENKVQAMARVKMIEIVLAYILGKPSTEFKLDIGAGNLAEDSALRIAALVATIKGGGSLVGGYEAITAPVVDAIEEKEVGGGEN